MDWRLSLRDLRGLEIISSLPVYSADSSTLRLLYLSPCSLFITARKRSLLQGNIFTPVYQSVHTGVSQHALQVASQHALQQGGAWSGGSAPGGCLVETPTRTATAAGGTHPTGMHSCSIIIPLLLPHRRNTCEPRDGMIPLNKFFIYVSHLRSNTFTEKANRNLCK